MVHHHLGLQLLNHLDGHTYHYQNTGGSEGESKIKYRVHVLDLRDIHNSGNYHRDNGNNRKIDTGEQRQSAIDLLEVIGLPGRMP